MDHQVLRIRKQMNTECLSSSMATKVTVMMGIFNKITALYHMSYNTFCHHTSPLTLFLNEQKWINVSIFYKRRRPFKQCDYFRGDKKKLKMAHY